MEHNNLFSADACCEQSAMPHTFTLAIRMKLSALVLVAWAVASCASVPELKQQLETKTEVTASISEMQFQPSHFSETEVVTLDREQPAFEFPEGKSFYAARAIPNAQTARMLQFKTYLSIQFLPKANVLVPYSCFWTNQSGQLGVFKPLR